MSTNRYLEIDVTPSPFTNYTNKVTRPCEDTSEGLMESLEDYFIAKEQYDRIRNERSSLFLEHSLGNYLTWEYEAKKEELDQHLVCANTMLDRCRTRLRMDYGIDVPEAQATVSVK